MGNEEGLVHVSCMGKGARREILVLRFFCQDGKKSQASLGTRPAKGNSFVEWGPKSLGGRCGIGRTFCADRGGPGVFGKRSA